jgi:hypothetical protein
MKLSIRVIIWWKTDEMLKKTASILKKCNKNQPRLVGRVPVSD